MPRAGQRQNAGNAPCLSSALSDCLLCGVVLLDRHNQIRRIAGEVTRILQCTVDELLNHPLEVLPPGVQQIVRQSSLSGETIINRPIDLGGQAGGESVCRLSVVPNQAPGMALFFTKVSCADSVERSIQQLDRLASLGTLASGMAHEIKNALVAGKTFIELLLEKHQDGDLVEVVRREMGRIDSIVSQMLKFASPAPSTFSPVPMHELLDQALKLLQPQIKDKHIVVHRRYAAESDRVAGDEFKLQQALLNLFLNALEAMGPSGDLRISTASVSAPAPVNGRRGRPARSLLRITIKDTGMGILAQHLGRLFEPFFTTKPHGTGLGLLMTRRIIQEHQGQISVESEPGKGAAFTLALPLSDSADRAGG